MQLPDMNLLPALDALLRTGSVAAAAEELSVSASAMSRTLGRLRRVVGDPLLVPAGRGLALTPRARELAPPVAAALADALRVLAPAEPDDLRDVERTLVVRCGDAAAMMLAPALTAAAARDAPGVALRLVPEGDEDPRDLRDTVDLDVGVLPPPIADDVRARPLATYCFVALARPGVLDAAPGVGAFAAVPHVVVSRRGRATGVIDDRLGEHGLTRRVLATVPSIGAACTLALAVDALALVPAPVAPVLTAATGLIRHPIPLDLPPVEVGMAWHHRLDADLAHRWLRRVVTAAVAPATAD